jgi:succinoglycan biosynthesis transport protein ExoP
LTELESNAQSYRTLYDDFLQRYTESVQAQSFPVTDARVVTPAARPLKKSHPRTFLVLAISAFGGTILGLLIGHLRDLNDQVFRTRDQVERLLGLDCLATVPKIKVRKSRRENAPDIKVGGEPLVSLPPAANLKVGDQPSDSCSPALNTEVNDEGKGNSAPNPDMKVSESNGGSSPTPDMKVSEPNGDSSPSSDIEVSEPNRNSSRAAEIDATSGPRTVARRDQLIWQVVDFPLSPYAEAIRSIKMAVDLTRARISKKVRKPKKIIGITSSSPSEGKSTIAASLAQLISHSGKRVMLVDCDLRAPRLTRVLAPGAKAGLLEVMSGDASLGDVIWTDQSKRLSFLPAVATARVPHTAEIIGAEEMQALFERLRGAYDYIIVDVTPLVPIIDVRATEGFIDHYIFVVEWGRTKIDLVERSLKEAAGIYNKILGAVLNKVDSGDLKRYEGYGSYDHDKYYNR